MNKIPLIGLVCTCMLVLFACTSEHKLTQKAIMRVLTDKKAFDTTGRLYLDIHPCANDTTFTTHTDTFTVVTRDTIYPKPAILQDIDVSSTGSIMPGIWDAGPVIVEKHKSTIRTKDTGFIVNKQREKLYQDEIAGLLQDKASLQQSVQDGQDALKATNKERIKWIWLFVGACVALGLVGGAWAYFGLIKGKVKTITNVLPH